MRQAIPRDGHRRRERPEKTGGKNISNRSTFHPGSLSVSRFVSIIRRHPCIAPRPRAHGYLWNLNLKVDVRIVFRVSIFDTPLAAGCTGAQLGVDTLR